jgi:hypothetical protein
MKTHRVRKSKEEEQRGRAKRKSKEEEQRGRAKRKSKEEEQRGRAKRKSKEEDYILVMAKFVRTQWLDLPGEI